MKVFAMVSAFVLLSAPRLKAQDVPAETAPEPEVTATAIATPATGPLEFSDEPNQKDAPAGEASAEPKTEEGAAGASAATEPKKGSVPDEYTIASGDTLWDICDKFLGNPWYWPKLWSLNQYIENPHLIFPGNKIQFFAGSETAPPQLDIVSADGKTKPIPETPQVGEAKEGPVAMSTPAPAPTATSMMEDFTGKPFTVRLKNLSVVTDKALGEAGSITHSGDQRVNLMAGDRVYMKFKHKDQVKVGDRFLVIERVKKVKDPRFVFGDLGYLVKRKGIVKIMALHKDTTEAVIADAEDTIERGDKVIPYTSLIRTVTPYDVTKKAEGVIVDSENLSHMISNNEFAYVSLGKKDGIEDGARLMVIRRGDGVFLGDDKKLPYVIVAKLLVVEALERTSTVYVLDVRDSLEIGDKVVTTLN